MTDTELGHYVSLMAKLTSPLIDESSSYQPEEENDDSDIEEGTAEEVESWLSQVTGLLNDPSIVDPLVKGIERCRDERVLRYVSSVCHNLLLADKSAMHKFSLLNSLAFKSSLLRKLWNLLIETKQRNSLGTPMPLLTVSIMNFSIDKVI